MRIEERRPGRRTLKTEERNSVYNEFKEGKPCIVFCKRLMEMGWAWTNLFVHAKNVNAKNVNAKRGKNYPALQ